MSAHYYIGTSGWHYDHWRGVFYPAELRKERWLEFYARHFATVEINNSFYRLPSENAVAGWRDASSPGFCFAMKVSRYVTHIKRLKDAEGTATFLERARILGEKLGPLLYQLPPGMHRSEERLESFLAALPRDCRHAFEFRHPSWFSDAVYDTLRRYGAALCLYDMPEFTTPVLATTDIAYMRFHGKQGLYSSNYSDGELARWAGQLGRLAGDLSAMYVYFNNDAEAYAVRNALTLDDFLRGAKPRGTSMSNYLCS